MTFAELLQSIAAALGVESIDPDASLTDQGLSSLQMMTLVEDWRAAGMEANFQRLLALNTAREWATELGVS